MSSASIIGLGGGGFSDEPDNPLLDLYVLNQARKHNPNICFLPTASGDADSYLLKYYKSFSQYACKPVHLSLFRPHTRDIEDFLLQQDVIYVGGGNTKSMLALWREWGLDVFLSKAWKNGTVLAGISAGAICWFEHGATDSIPGRISALPCLGFAEGSCCPHFDNEPMRREQVPKLIESGEMQPGFAIDNSAAVHIKNGKLLEAVSSINGRKVYKVSRSGIEPLETRFLG